MYTVYSSLPNLLRDSAPPIPAMLPAIKKVSQIDAYNIFSNQVKVKLHDLLQYKVSHITSQGLGVGGEISLKLAKPP